MRKCVLHEMRPGAVSAVTALAVLLSGCVPFLADHQSASLLAPGQAELTPSVSYVLFSADGETDHIQTHLGLRAAYGVAPRAELRATYERVEVTDADDGMNVLGFGAKFSLLPERVALYLPVGFVTGGGVDAGDSWTTVPTLLVNAVRTRTFELVPSLKVFVPISGEGREAFVGFHLGAGLSSDLSRWALRPEVGLVRNPGEDGTTWGVSLGVSIRP